MAILQTTANAFRAAIAKREELAATRLVESYGSIYANLETLLNQITRKIILAQQNGLTVSPAWLYQQARLEELTRLVEQQVSDYAVYANRHITSEQLYAIQKAQADSTALILDSLGPIKGGIIPANFLRFNPKAVETFLGRASDGSPLADLFKELAADSVKKIESVFVDGIVRGLNPKTVAKTLANDFEIPLQRSLVISRTEVLNAYRDTNLDAFQHNEDIVTRWRWVCAHQDRTCAMCLALDGREFPTQVSMGTHPNCRCTLIPVTKTWEELGFQSEEETSARITENGAEWFDRQSDASKLRVLGPGKLELYKEGKLTLLDLVGFKDDPKWGDSRYERSLRQFHANEGLPPKAKQGILP